MIIRIINKIIRELYRMLHPLLWGKNLQINGIPKIYDIKKLKIGDNVSINSGCVLQSYGGLTVGNNVTLSDGAKILTRSLDVVDYLSNAQLAERIHVDKPVSIGSGVWIATNAVVLPGVTIADNIIVAAGAVVTENLNKEGYIYGGVPAKLIKACN